MVCNAQTLQAAAIDFDRLSDRELAVVTAGLLALIYGQLSGTILNAKSAVALCADFARLDQQSLMAVEVGVLCQIATASGA